MNQIVIVAPMDGSPAQKAGLKTGRRYSQGQRRGCRGLPLEQVVTRILGRPGNAGQIDYPQPEHRRCQRCRPYSDPDHSSVA